MIKLIRSILLMVFFLGIYISILGQESEMSLLPHRSIANKTDNKSRSTQDFSLMSFQQIVTKNYEGSTQITDKGRVTIFYSPAAGNQYFNMTIYNYNTSQYFWVIQNLLLVGQQWTTYPQQVSVWFPLSLLGIVPGQILESIDYISHLSTYPITQMPTGNMMWDYVTLTNLYTKGKTSDVLPEDSPFQWFPDSWLDLILSDVVHISCNEEDPTSMPNIDLDKGTRDGELNGCGPAAATNSLQWLKKVHDQINFPADIREGFNQLSSLMNRKANETVSDVDFIKAKVDFVEMYNLPIKVKYQDDGTQGPVKSSTGRTQAECMDADAAAYPTKDFLVNEAKNGEDVEVGVTFPADVGGGHWVALNGTYTIGGNTYINYKHDGNQEVAGSTTVDNSRVVIEDGKMKLPGLDNGTIDIIVSESFDPNYSPPSSTVNYEKYCQWSKRIIPPGYKIEVTYPNDVERCYNSTIWIYDKSVDPPKWKKDRVWNFNKGKVRKFVNETTLPIIIAIHNDDKYSSGTGILLKTDLSYSSYTVDIPPAEPTEQGDVTDADNENEYAGFSLGSDDDSSEEFGDITDAAINFTVDQNCSLGDLPKSMNPNGTTSLTVTYNVTELNDYWSDLEFNLGIVSVDQPGTLTLTFSTLQVEQNIDLEFGMEEVTLDIGGVTLAGDFQFSISIEGTNTSFTIDNIGIASKVPMPTTYVDEVKVIPTEFQLMQNFPNPFNPTTTISFALPTAEHVTLKIYNTLGQEIAVLIDEFMQAGYHNIEWNIGTLSSGTYFYKLIAGSFSDTKKCVILK